MMESEELREKKKKNMEFMTERDLEQQEGEKASVKWKKSGRNLFFFFFLNNYNLTEKNYKTSTKISCVLPTQISINIFM